MSSRSAILSASSGYPRPEKSTSRFSAVRSRCPLYIARTNPPFLLAALVAAFLLSVLGYFSWRVPDHARRHPDGELARRDVLVHHAPGPEVGVLADGYRRYEVRIDPGEDAAPYGGAMLVLPVVVRRDRTRPQVHPLADLRIPDVGEVRDLALRSNPRVLEFAVGPDLRSLPEHRSRSQVSVRPHGRARADRRASPDRVLDERPVSHHRVQEVRGRADHAVRAYPRLPTQESTRQDDRVASDLHARLYVRTGRIPHRHPSPHVGVQDTPPHDLLRHGQL